MKEILRKIISEILEDARADKLLQPALEKESLSGEFYLLSVGKAAIAMAETAIDFFGSRIKESLVITAKQYAYDSQIKYLTSDHPFAGENSIIAGRKAVELVSRLKRGDQLLLLVSGGASAMLEYPMEGVTLFDINDLTSKLQKVGADIIELNTVRKHLSQTKGGRLARLAEPANIYGFILSDVIDDRLDTIGSGLSAADKTTSKSALEILDKYKIRINEDCEKALKTETPKNLRNAVNRIIGNNELLCHLAAERILKNGYVPWLVTTGMSGEARYYARIISDIIKKVQNPKSEIRRPCIAICGGETTVTVTGKGKGGRNLEIALAAALNIQELKNVTVAAIASDGYDGNSGFAGAVIDENSYTKMLSAGIRPEVFLKNNDSATALQKIDAVIDQKNTSTNLNDLLLVMID